MSIADLPKLEVYIIAKSGPQELEQTLTGVIKIENLVWYHAWR